MKNYVPFLKTKRNEFSALKNLEKNIAENLTPFFEIHRKAKIYEEGEYKNFIGALVNKFKLNTVYIKSFYLDDYDIDDKLQVDGEQSYKFVINSFLPFSFIPVMGIDRTEERNNVVLNNKNKFLLDRVAIRITYEDSLAGYFELKKLINQVKDVFSNIDLIIDLRVIQQDSNTIAIYTNIEKFLSKIDYNFSKVIITGSSISEVVSDYIRTDTKKTVKRKELEVFKLINQKHSDFFYGDYTVVSPNFSESDIPGVLMQKLTTAKVSYPYGDVFYICRGNSLEKKGNDQYKQFCNHISNQLFFRGATYSYGDSFIKDALQYPKNITPGSILCPTINAHISYMYKDYQL